MSPTRPNRHSSMPRQRGVRSIAIAGASLALALFVVTCVNDRILGPGHYGAARFNFNALSPAVLGVPVPVESLEIRLTRSADQSLALDTVMGFHAGTAAGDSAVIRLNVLLKESPEEFLLTIRAYGLGVTWYTSSTTTQISTGAAATPVLLTAIYTGTGANAAGLVIGPRDTTVLGGVAIPLQAVVSDSTGKVIANVPVGYRLSDTSEASVTYPTPYTAVLTTKTTVRDSLWIVGETPTHVKDSTRVHIIPPPATLIKVSGDSQTGPVELALAPFVVRVLDKLNGGFKGQTVTWSISAGTGTLSAPTTTSDDTGYASVLLTPAGTGPVTVLASAGALAGSPQKFSYGTALTGPANLSIVSGNGQSDTVRSALAPFVVKATDASNNPVAGAKVAWSRIAGAGSVSADTTLTDAAGQAQIGYTLGSVVGTEQVRASLAGTSVTVLFTATVTPGGGTVVSTAVTPSLDTLTALTATTGLTARAKNSAGNQVAGSFTWVSRAPAVATVSSTGLVTAVANGSTYVVVTESGGTSDSALIVVRQRVATVNVTPSVRNLYLTRTLLFTAAAVDGLGYPVAPAASFTWSSTAPAIASVDSTGDVTAAGLGTAQIRATAGAITGVAQVTVLTPITRIAVVLDTAGAAKTDSFTLTSLGLSRRYRAIAHDTLDAVMSGVSFTWVSTNGSVAVLGSTQGDTTTATAAANGVTQIQATAQGFTSTPGALLTVSQVLASIALSPPAGNPTATIAIGGTMGLVARGKDANNRFIAGGAFRFSSATPAVATVDTASGVVTGVANGASDITATSGPIVSNPLSVTVGGTVPAIISFGRDTVAVGRGSSASIPILLSVPPTAPLTLQLAASGFAHWSPSSIVIPANVTSANAVLVGDSAGTATVTATDGTGLYAGATAVAKVTANMRLTSSSYSVNATDVVSTQVLLSDPSPAGGTYVTFNYSVPGVAAISPDPAFIPSGQLAADIQIRAVGAGTTSITPNAVGVNGSASTLTAYAPVLTNSAGSILLGVGQYDPGAYVYTPTYTNLPVQVTLTSSDTSVATVTSPVAVPANSYYAYFTTTARTQGTARITPSAPGWTAAGATTVIATTPYLGVCCSNTGLFTTSPQQTVTVYAEDSTRYAHPRSNSLVVRLRSTDTTIVKLLDSVVAIAPGQSYTNSGRFVMGGLGGTAYIVASAGGHQSDSALYTVSGPPLTFSWGGTALVGAGQYEPGVYVYVPNNVSTALVVSLSTSDSTVASVPATVTIPANSYYAYFSVVGGAPGGVTIHASAPGYNPADGSWRVTTPRVTACCSTTLNNFGPGTGLNVYTTDSLGYAHYRNSPLVVSLRSTDATVATIDSSAVTVDSGQNYNNQPHITPVGVGTARLVYSAPGQAVVDSVTITVVTPPIQFSFQTALLGRRQHFDPNNNGFYVYTPDYRATPLAATIRQLHGGVDSLSTAAPNIPASTYYTYLDAYGLATGTDTLIVSAPGYLPDTAVLIVTTPGFTACCMPSQTTTTNPPLGITVYATDSVGSRHYTMDTVVVAAATSDTTVIQPGQATFPIARNTEYANTTLNVLGPGTANATYSDAAGTGYASVTTSNVTVTGPALALSNGSSMLGMRQTSGPNGNYVSVPNNVGTPLVVHLVSTGPRVATVPDSVTIPVGTYYAYFPVTAQDTLGTIQIQASATGYSPAAMNVQVTAPKFLISTSAQLNTTSAAQNITVYAADANGVTHYTTENVAVTLTSSAPGVAAIDSGTVTIPAGQYSVSTATWKPGIVGTAQLQAADARAAYYRYNPAAFTVAVITPTLSFSTPGYLGLGQYQDYNFVAAPDYQSAPLTVTLSHSGATRTAVYDNLTVTPIASVVIPTGSYYEYFRLAGASVGVDTLVASASVPAHNAATAYTVVTAGRVDPIMGWPVTLAAGDSAAVTLYARDSVQNAHNLLNATTWTLAPNANIQFTSGGATSTVITSVTIPADQQSVTFYVRGVAAGTGNATLTATNYHSYSNIVTVTP